MRIRTNLSIFNWFEHYQGGSDPKKMSTLYQKLIKEEEEELEEAFEQEDIVEAIDAIADIYWVKLGKRYFSNDWYEKVEYDFSDMVDSFCQIEERFGLSETKDAENFLDEVINEISRSNWTKVRKLAEDGEKAGKVIKGPNYSKPDLVPIIEKHLKPKKGGITKLTRKDS